MMATSPVRDRGRARGRLDAARCHRRACTFATGPPSRVIRGPESGTAGRVRSGRANGEARRMGDEAGALALVIGGGSGIGAALADAYRAQGTTTVTWDIAGSHDVTLRRHRARRHRRCRRGDPRALGRPDRRDRHRRHRPCRAAERGGPRCLRPGHARQCSRPMAVHAGLGRRHARGAGRRLLRRRLERQRTSRRPQHGHLLRVEGRPVHAGPGRRRRMGRARDQGQRSGARRDADADARARAFGHRGGLALVGRRGRAHRTGPLGEASDIAQAIMPSTAWSG